MQLAVFGGCGMALRRGVAIGTAVALALCGSTNAGVHRYYYDPVGRLVGATSDSGWQRLGRSDKADNATYLNVLQTVGPSAANTLPKGGGLIVDQSLTSTSSNGPCTLVLQSSGNLVITQGSTTVWSTGTSGNLPGFLEMNYSGQLYLYGPDGVSLWTSGNTASNGASAVLGTDCVLRIMQGSQTIWSS